MLSVNLKEATEHIEVQGKTRSLINSPDIAFTRTNALPLLIMINAVLVFNNNGQPRLTKFYTQLVGLQLAFFRLVLIITGYGDAANVAFPDLLPGLCSSSISLQFPITPSIVGSVRYLELSRCTNPDYLSPLRHALFHPDLHFYGVPAGIARFHSSIRGSARQTLRKCMRVGPDLWI